MIVGLRLFSVFIFACCLGFAAHGQQQPATGTPPVAAAPVPAAPADPAVPMLKQAYQMVMDKNLDGALTLTNDAVKSNPKSFAALTLRGMIYTQKKDWINAESDLNGALAMDPSNVVVKFNLADIKFVQKQYDQARTRFLALESDPAMGDFACYEVFLCDLIGNQQAAAAKELAVFNAAESHPSYYFSNAAWDLVHKDTEGARSWLVSASNIYQPTKNQFYATPLRDLGYLPLPAPAQ
jgi:Tfp pilus assembly protein PilF